MKGFNLLYKRLKKVIVIWLMFTSFSLINPVILINKTKSLPVKNPIITQGYSLKHQGLDLIDRYNDKRVYSIIRCKVIDKNFTGNGSPYLTCYDFNNKIFYKYIHITSNLNLGQILDTGDCIGKYNNKGNAKGYHLHLEVYDLENNFDKDGKRWL